MAYSSDLYKITVTMGVKSNIPADSVVFDLHYVAPGATDDADFDAMAVTIGHFLNSTPTGQAAAINALLGNTLSTSAAAVQVAFYLIPTGGGDSGPPVAVRSVTLGAVHGDSLPEECAVCMSFNGDLTGIPEFSGATRPRSRRRNRIYLGPFGQGSVLQDGTTKRTFVDTTTVAIIQAAAIQFLYTEAFGNGWLWRVVSRTAVADYPVFQVSIDNAWDTQRRRGPAPTARAVADVA